MRLSLNLTRNEKDLASSKERRSNMRTNALLAVLALSAPALADFTSPYTPDFRGDPGTEFAHWDNWTSAFMGPNSPDDPASTNPDTLLFQMNPGAIVTSGMIYSPPAPPSS